MDRQAGMRNIDKDYVDSYQSEEAASILSTTLIYLLKLGNLGDCLRGKSPKKMR